MIAPYYSDDTVTLYLGDFREVLPTIDITDVSAVVTDPPYGETRLAWDTWPVGWPAALADAGVRSLWCFGSMRMFFDRLPEFATWKLAQDVVWEKHNGTGAHKDRFRRVHEHAVHFYRGPWSGVHHVTPTTSDAAARIVRRTSRPAHWQGAYGPTTYVSDDGGQRLMRSVIYARSRHGNAINETEKPLGVVMPLVEYSTPRGGGSCSMCSPGPDPQAWQRNSPGGTPCSLKPANPNAKPPQPGSPKEPSRKASHDHPPHLRQLQRPPHHRHLPSARGFHCPIDRTAMQLVQHEHRPTHRRVPLLGLGGDTNEDHRSAP